MLLEVTYAFCKDRPKGEGQFSFYVRFIGGFLQKKVLGKMV